MLPLSEPGSRVSPALIAWPEQLTRLQSMRNRTNWVVWPDRSSAVSSEFVLRLAHYRGMQTDLSGAGGKDVTHWARLSNGYSRVVDGQTTPPEHMLLAFAQEFHSPLERLFRKLDITPGVGSVSEARLHQSAKRPLAAAKP